MGFQIKRSRNIHDYVFCVIIGLVTGFLISTYLSTKWKVRLIPCSFAHPNSQLHMLQTSHFGRDGARTKLLLICVLTTRRHLESRALALHRVLTPDLYSDVIFFIGGEESYNGNLPVVILNGISDDEYPPRRKSFAMLHYVNQFHGNNFNWFMRVDDDININLKKLETLLFRLNAEDEVYLGHPGLGTQKEFGHLGLEGDNPYCMGGPGIVLSRKLLNGIAGRLSSCLNSTASVHEDSELGRCIFKYFALSCTRSEEVKIKFSQSYEDTSGMWTEDMGLVDYLTFHPVKNENFTYKTFIRERSNSIFELENKILKLQSEISTVSFILGTPLNTSRDTLRDHLDVRISWSCDYKLNYYSLRLKEWVEPSSHKGRSLSYMKARRGLVKYVEEQDIKMPVKLSLLSYRRLVPRKGLQFMFATKDGDDVFRIYFAMQRFYSLHFSDSLIPHNFTNP